MINVYTACLFHYEVSGDREQEAAAILNEKIDFYDRALGYGHISSDSHTESIIGVIAQLESEYSVKIVSEIGA